MEVNVGIIYTIEVVRFDTNLLVLGEKMHWNDYLVENQTEYIYLTIDTTTAEEQGDFIVGFQRNDTRYNLTFRNCVK